MYPWQFLRGKVENRMVIDELGDWCSMKGLEGSFEKLAKFKLLVEFSSSAGYVNILIREILVVLLINIRLIRLRWSIGFLFLVHAHVSQGLLLP